MEQNNVNLYNDDFQSSLLWLVPTLVMFSVFSSQPDKLFLSTSCSDFSPLGSLDFRAAFTSAIFIPVTIIAVTYSYFYLILSQRTR